jgi:hypothetical protein
MKNTLKYLWSAYQILVSDNLFHSIAVTGGCTSYGTSSVPVMAEVHEILVILNIFSLMAVVCFWKLCVILA